jgi:hypothetical protein
MQKPILALHGKLGLSIFILEIDNCIACSCSVLPLNNPASLGYRINVYGV